MKLENPSDFTPSPASDSADQARELAQRAEALAAEIDALHLYIRAAGDEGVRRTGFRFDAARGSVRQAAAELRDTVADLDRIAASAAPGTCSVQWGGCPAHGNTLISSGGRTWCRNATCEQAWDYDGVGLPCTDPVRWKLIDQYGDGVLVCHGHAVDARGRLESAHLVPVGVEWRKGQA